MRSRDRLGNPITKKPTRACQACGLCVIILKNGTMRVHNYVDVDPDDGTLSPPRRCVGSGKEPR